MPAKGQSAHMPLRQYVTDAEHPAPYWRFRPTDFYGAVYGGGSYTGDIMWCSWQCEHCWSGYGWVGQTEPRYVLKPDEVAHKLVEGMKRNAQASSRLSGGEPTLYWDHLFALCGEFIERTEGLFMRANGVTHRDGEPLVLVIETHGALLDFEKIERLDQEWGESGRRIALSFGLKATDGAFLGELTGMPTAIAERNHAKQLENFLYTALETEHLEFFAGFLDKYTDAEVFAKLQRVVERKRPGRGRHLSVNQFRSYRGSKARYKPKVERGGRPDADSPNEEVIDTAFAGETVDPEARAKGAAAMEHLPEGQLRAAGETF